MSRRVVLLCLCALLSSPCMARSDDVTFDEMRAAYLQNMEAVGRFELVIERMTDHTDVYWQVLRERVERYRALKGRIGHYEDDAKRQQAERTREILDREIPRLQALLDSQRIYPTRRRARLVVGLSSLQVIVPTDGRIPPQQIVRQQDLIKECANVVALTWSREQTPTTWVWQGVHARADGEVSYATISSRRPQNIVDFPPIPIGARTDLFFDSRELSPFDAFYQHAFNETEVVGTERLDDEEVVVVERRRSTNGTLWTFRASLAVNHNYIPVQIVSGGQTLRVKSFQTLPGAAYYLQKWTITHTGMDDRHLGSEGSSSPSSPKQPVMDIETRSVSEFRQLSDDPALFEEIGFPAGTNCFDDDSETSFIVGQPAEQDG